MTRVLCLAVLALCAFVSVASGEEGSTPSLGTWGHAHNDYRHPLPLFDALDHGFRSIEADVLLVNGELMVGHDRVDVKPDRTLSHLYLEPLFRLYRDGHAALSTEHASGPLLLLIDIKTEAEPAYLRLKELLEQCRPMLTRFEKGGMIPGAVMVVISGNRPVDLMAQETERLAAVDGRLTDLDRETSPSLMPLVSDHWNSHFTWDGCDAMPIGERTRLIETVTKAHAAGLRLRFWATPECESVWHELLTARVDYINTDRLEDLQDFLKNAQEGKCCE